MKKVYLKPVMEIEEVEVQTIIAASGVGGSVSAGDDKSDGYGDAKQRGIWGDLWYENQ